MALMNHSKEYWFNVDALSLVQLENNVTSVNTVTNRDHKLKSHSSSERGQGRKEWQHSGDSRRLCYATARRVKFVLELFVFVRFFGACNFLLLAFLKWNGLPRSIVPFAFIFAARILLHLNFLGSCIMRWRWMALLSGGVFGNDIVTRFVSRIWPVRWGTGVHNRWGWLQGRFPRADQTGG